MVNLELYRIFYEVAVKGSFSAAANALFVSQPAVSQAMGQLESQLGLTLFERRGKGVSLTTQGQVLFGYVEPFLKGIRQGEQHLLKMRQLKAGWLMIGAGDTVSRHFLLDYLERYHNLYPAVKLQFVNRTSHEIVTLLKEGKIDMGFVNMPLEDKSLHFTPCLTLHDVFVASEKFAALKGQSLTFEEMAKQPLIMLEKISNSRQYADEFFKEQGTPLSPDIELGSHDLLLEFARIGLGLACVIREFSTEYLEEGSLFEVPLQNPLPPRHMAICTTGKPLSPAAQKFLELIPTR